MHVRGETANKLLSFVSRVLVNYRGFLAHPEMRWLNLECLGVLCKKK